MIWSEVPVDWQNEDQNVPNGWREVPKSFFPIIWVEISTRYNYQKIRNFFLRRIFFKKIYVIFGKMDTITYKILVAKTTKIVGRVQYHVTDFYHL